MVVEKIPFTLDIENRVITIERKIPATKLYSLIKEMWTKHSNLTGIAFPLREVIGNITDAGQTNYFVLQHGWTVSPMSNVTTEFVKTTWSLRGSDPAG